MIDVKTIFSVLYIKQLPTNEGHSHVGGIDELFSSGHESEARVRRETLRDVEVRELISNS